MPQKRVRHLCRPPQLRWPKQRRGSTVLLLLWGSASVTVALASPAIDKAAMADTGHGADAERGTLCLEEARTAAVEQSPALSALSHLAVAARERAVAARQLPDPALTVGVSDLTIEGRQRFTLHDEPNTQLMAGVRQEVTREHKRELAQRRLQQEGLLLESKHAELQRSVARDVSIAYLEAWKFERAVALLKRNADEASHQRDASRIGLRANQLRLADYKAGEIDAAMAQERVAAAELEVVRARAQLARWLGDEFATKPLCARLGNPTLLVDQASTVDTLLARLSHHPTLQSAEREIAVAQLDVDLAEQAFVPDWAITIGYGYRPAFADYLQVQVEIPLPLFTSDRQSRMLTAAREEREAADARAAQVMREQWAALRLRADELKRVLQRLERFDAELLPLAQQRVEGELASFAANRSSFSAVLAARRASLDLELQRLELEAEAWRQWIELRFYSDTEGAS